MFRSRRDSSIQGSLVYHTKGISDIFPITENKDDSNTEYHEDVIDFRGVNLALFAGGRVHHLDAREIIKHDRLLDNRKGSRYQ